MTDTEMWAEIEGNPIHVELVLLTPDAASELLKLNHDNRKVRSSYVKGLTETLKHGAFKFNGATVVISIDNDLLDGQHRLKAIEASGVAAWVLIVTGVSKDAMPTIDQGTPRTAADILAWLNPDLKNTSQVSAIARIALMLMNGTSSNPSREDVAQWADENADSLEWAASLSASLAKAARSTSFLTLRMGSRPGGKVAVGAAMLGVLALYLERGAASRANIELFLNTVVRNYADPETPKVIQALRRRWAGESPFNASGNIAKEIVMSLDVAVGAFNSWVSCTESNRLQSRREENLSRGWDDVRPVTMIDKRSAV